MNVLITSASRKVPLTQAFQRALSAKLESGLVWAGDADPECVSRYFADRFWEMPALEDLEPERLLRWCEEQGVGLVVPTRDGELPYFAQIRATAAERGISVAGSPPEAVAVCSDKLRFWRECGARGLPAIPTHTRVGDLDGDRLVVKERRGAGARRVALDVDRVEAERLAASLDEPIFQPFIAGTEFSVDLFTGSGEEWIGAVPRERVRVHAGESVITETVEAPDLVATCKSLAGALGLRGHAVIQAISSEEGIALIECNPRVGGASSLAFEAGLDSPAWMIAEAMGRDVPRDGWGYEVGLRMVRAPVDEFIRR